jgi:hypothetical protein
MCAEPPSAVPSVKPFEPPPLNALGSFQVTLHNQCVQTVWPAYGSTGGLDNSVLDTQLWFALAPGSDRTITVYGGVRELAFWGRTGCSFDQDGNGSCQTGDCGRFICPVNVGALVTNATVFSLEGGFSEGYNVGLLVEGDSCGSHECSADLSTCEAASVVKNACGQVVACSDICGASTNCCPRPGCEATGVSRGDATDNIVLTFCP